VRVAVAIEFGGLVKSICLYHTVHTHTIYLRPAAEPKGLLTLSDTTLLMLHRGLISPCTFFDSLLHAACCPRQSPCLISVSHVLYLSSLIRRLWVSVAGGRLAQSRLLQEILQVFSVLSAAAEALSALYCTRLLMSIR
jgi:hypothetical protein